MHVHYDDSIEVHRSRALWRDVLIGMAAGVVGTWVMDRWQEGLGSVEEKLSSDEDRDAGSEADDPTTGGPVAVSREGESATGDGVAVSREVGGGEGAEESGEDHALDDIAVVGPYHREGERANETAGRILHRKVSGQEPSDARVRELAHRVHWATGMGMGAVYGLVRGTSKGPDITGGLAFGAGVWLLLDELAVPLLGLSGGPAASSAKDHAEALAAHLVYGAATAASASLLDAAT